LLRLIRHSPGYCQYKYAISAALEGCSGIPDFLPQSVRARHGSFDAMATRSAQDKRALDAEYRAAIDFSPEDPRYAGDVFRRGPAAFVDSDGHDERTTDLRYLFEGRGVSMQDWSIDPGGHYVFGDGVYDLSVLRDLLQLADSDLYGIGPDCATLKTKSLAALKGAVL